MEHTKYSLPESIPLWVKQSCFSGTKRPAKVTTTTKPQQQKIQVTHCGIFMKMTNSYQI